MYRKKRVFRVWQLLVELFMPTGKNEWMPPECLFLLEFVRVRCLCADMMQLGRA